MYFHGPFVTPHARGKRDKHIGSAYLTPPGIGETITDREVEIKGSLASKRVKVSFAGTLQTNAGLNYWP